MKATGMPQVSQKHINPEFIVSKKRAGIHHLIIPVFARNFNSDKSIICTSQKYPSFKFDYH